MSVNKVILVGNLGKDPELLKTLSGTSLCKFSVATTERYKNRQGEQQTKTEWHNIIAWGRLAETCGEWLYKGKQVYIEGKLQTTSYAGNDGIKRYSTQIVASLMQMLGRATESEGAHNPVSQTDGFSKGYPDSWDSDDHPDKTFLIIDDLFLSTAYRQFLNFYIPIHGDKVKTPLSYSDIIRGVEHYTQKSIAETHVFYLSDRPSAILTRHFDKLAEDFDGWDEDYDLEDGEELLATSLEAVFHKSNFLALEAASFAAGCTSAVVFADDPTYEAAKECNDLIFIRNGGGETSMPGDVTWQNAAYIFCFACGVDP